MSKTSSALVKNPSYRVLLVDGMEFIRIALNQIIYAASQLTICAATGDYDEVPELIRRHRPHLMIGEPFQSGRDGITWVKDLRANHPETKILAVSLNAENLFAQRILRAGASGYWMKNGSSAELLKAIETVLNGEVYLSPTVGSLATQRFVCPSAKRFKSVSHLSDREFAVFSLLAARQGTREIARKLGISRKTVETHYANIKRKLGYHDAAALKRGARESLG